MIRNSVHFLRRFYAAVLAGALVCPPPALALRNLSPADNAGLEDELRRSLQDGAKPEPQRAGTEGVWKWEHLQYRQVIAAASAVKRKWFSWVLGLGAPAPARREVSRPDANEPIQVAWVGSGNYLQIPWDVLVTTGYQGLSFSRDHGAVDSYLTLFANPEMDKKGVLRVFSRWARRIKPGGQAVRSTSREVGVDAPGPVWTGLGDGFSARKTAAGVQLQLSSSPPHYYVEIREPEPLKDVLARIDQEPGPSEARDLLLMDLALRKTIPTESADAVFRRLLSALSDEVWVFAHPNLSILLAQSLPRFEGLSKTQLDMALSVLETRLPQAKGEMAEAIRDAMAALQERKDEAGLAAGAEQRMKAEEFLRFYGPKAMSAAGPRAEQVLEWLGKADAQATVVDLPQFVTLYTQGSALTWKVIDDFLPRANQGQPKSRFVVVPTPLPPGGIWNQVALILKDPMLPGVFNPAGLPVREVRLEKVEELRPEDLLADIFRSRLGIPASQYLGALRFTDSQGRERLALFSAA